MDNIHLIDEGIKHLKKGEFLDAIDKFEEYLITDRSNYLVYYYLALAYIYRENYDEAYNYIRKAYDLNPDDTDILNTIAFLQLKFNNINEAINYWLDILDIEPSNFLVRRNLEKVRKTANVEKLHSRALPENFLNLKLIKSGKKLFVLNKKIILSITSVLAVIGIIITIILISHSSNKQKVSEAALNSITIDKLKDDYIVDNKIKKSLFSFKPGELKRLFISTKKFIKNQEYNRAVIAINKVLHSNAGIPVREKFQILKTFIPDKREKIKYKLKYSDLMNFPTLYQDVFIKWYGKVEDIEVNKEETVFNFIVKEDNSSIGMAKVIFQGKSVADNLHNEDVIYIEGKFVRLDETLRIPIIYAVKLITEEER